MSQYDLGCCACEMSFDLNDDDYVVTECGHIFHRRCLDGGIWGVPVCPTCNCYLNNDYLHPVSFTAVSDHRFSESVWELEELRKKSDSLASSLEEKDKKIQALERTLNELEEKQSQSNVWTGGLQGLRKQLDDQDNEIRKLHRMLKAAENTKNQKVESLQMKLDAAYDRLNALSNPQGNKKALQSLAKDAQVICDLLMNMTMPY